MLGQTVRHPIDHLECFPAPAHVNEVRFSTDEVVSNYLSTSFAAPDRFGDRLPAFVADLRTLLTDVAPAGRFHDWPGDTAAVWAVKRR